MRTEECQPMKTKNRNRLVAFCAALTMLGVELPSNKETEKIDFPTKGMKGLSNSELEDGLSLKNKRKKSRKKRVQK